MIVPTAAQTAVRNGRLTGHRVAETLSAFMRDAGEFARDNPLLLVGLVALAVVVFGMTRPRVH
ncbi:MAG TPA: hypothetical protein VLA09_00755 [Longimicrobiales bacterium]|nr:hypothetical protein [Longimicrobiales bacterium]